MELGLSLGEASGPFGFMEKPREASNQFGLGFSTTLSIGTLITEQRDQYQEQEETANQKLNKHNINSESRGHNTSEEEHEAKNEYLRASLKANNNAVLQLDLLPHTPAAAPIHPPLHLSFFPWQEYGSCSRVLNVNSVAAEDEAEEGAALSSSPNSAASSFQMDLCMYGGGGSMSGEGCDQRGCSRASDEDENGGSTRKKLRLSKEQSAFLEESFKEHNTLNPKQKLALAKQLHLSPRQVEVWFQNRRARTKLKQTEVDCEYLKRCCETLTEENRRLHKEIQELRALKSSNPFNMQLPATTLIMCPSCERIAPNSTSTSSATFSSTNAGANAIAVTATANTINEPTSRGNELPLGKMRFYPFSHTQPLPHQSTSS